MTIFETDYQIRLPNSRNSAVLFNDGVPEIISEATFQSDKGAAHLLIDWQKAIDDFMMYDAFFYVPCKVQSPTDHIADNNYYINYYLYQVFLALNLSSPGCCTLQGTTIPSTMKNDDLLLMRGHTLELRGYAGQPFTLSSGELWPTTLSIPLSHTWNWLQSLRPNIQPVAQTRAERALFAMLHVAKDDSLSPSRLIWLAHALETLFDTSVENITRTLRDRIFLVLGEPTSHSRRIRQAINSFYDLRSSFVHGELAIAHPLGNPALHEEIAKLETSIMKNANLAISIIWAVLQLLVRENWREIQFSESFSGLPL